MAFTSERYEFDRRGLRRLLGAVPASDAAQMRNRLWQHLQQTHR